MERDLLKRYLENGLSLPEIGKLEGRHPSTVGYWVKKRGLVANGKAKFSARGCLAKKVLAPLVNEGLTVGQIAELVDRSPRTVHYWLTKHGLRTNGRRGRRPAVPREVVRRALQAGSRTVSGACRKHGQTVFVIESSGRVRCRQCRMDRVADRRRKVKRILIKEAGGRCSRCGYDRFVGALHFHHLDPARKEFAVSGKGATFGIDVLRQEAAKCIVLCANCHAEVEAGIGSLPDDIAQAA